MAKHAAGTRVYPGTRVIVHKAAAGRHAASGSRHAAKGGLLAGLLDFFRQSTSQSHQPRAQAAYYGRHRDQHSHIT